MTEPDALWGQADALADEILTPPEDFPAAVATWQSQAETAVADSKVDFYRRLALFAKRGERRHRFKERYKAAGPAVRDTMVARLRGDRAQALKDAHYMLDHMKLTQREVADILRIAQPTLHGWLHADQREKRNQRARDRRRDRHLERPSKEDTK